MSDPAAVGLWFFVICVSTLAFVVWVALGVYATWVDTREDEEPDTDEKELR